MAKKDDNKLCERGKRAAKAKYDKYPSAYANGYAVQVCKGTKPDASGKKKKASGYRKGGYVARRGEFSEGGLAEWFGKNDGKGWVDCKTGKACGRKSAKDSDRPYPACRPTMSDCKKQKPKTKKDSSKRVEWEKKKK
jgi:hypothetical protein